MRKRQKKLLEEAQANARAELVRRTGAQGMDFDAVSDAVSNVGEHVLHLPNMQTQPALLQQWSPRLLTNSGRRR